MGHRPHGSPRCPGRRGLRHLHRRPTGNAFHIRMVTVGHWNADGLMDEEYLFWDNAEFMRQLGLGQ